LTLLDLKARYRGSMFGILWALLQPLFMLAVYAFIFNFIFKPRWGFGPEGSSSSYILAIFCGLLVFNVFRDCVTGAPNQMWIHRSYVKRMVFPLEILPVTVLHLALGLVVLLAAAVLSTGVPSIHILLLPLLLLPLCLTCLAAAWFLASFGVFLRDVGQAVQMVVQVVFFLSPVVYPLAAVPEPVRSVLRLNPLSIFIDGARDVLLFGRAFDWSWWGLSLVVSLGAFCAGHAWFMATKGAFPDMV
jgi:lipopolysaccharide transport system permease protein